MPFGKESGKKELFKIEVAGISKKVNYYDGLFSVKPHTHISAIAKIQPHNYSITES